MLRAQPRARRAVFRGVTGVWSSCWQEALDALYPPSCWICGALAADGFACAAHRLVAETRAARCGRCAVRLPRGVAGGERCIDCRREAPAFARTFVFGDWGPGALREWLLAFKHGGRRELARPLAAELLGRLEGQAFDCVVPVPLHPLRRFSRGYDQAHRLARELGELGGWRTRRLLARTRATSPQGAPGAVSRAANVHGAFRARLFAGRALDGRHVLLVDDVITSGSTVRECATVLMRAGAREVSVAALARASRATVEAVEELDPPPE